MLVTLAIQLLSVFMQLTNAGRPKVRRVFIAF